MKNKLLTIALFTIPIVAFNALLFLLGDTSKFNASTWVAYAGIHLAWVACICTPFMISRDDHPVNTGVIYGISLSFFALQMVVGLIIILINPESIVFTLILEVLLFVAFAVVFFVFGWANSVTAQEERVRREEKQPQREYLTRVRMLISKTPDMDLRRSLTAIADRLQRMPIKNASAASELNLQIESTLAQMERTMLTKETAGGLINELQKLIEQREQMLKYSH